MPVPYTYAAALTTGYSDVFAMQLKGIINITFSFFIFSFFIANKLRFIVEIVY